MSHDIRCPNCGKFQAHDSDGFFAKPVCEDPEGAGVELFCNELCYERYLDKHEEEIA